MQVKHSSTHHAVVYYYRSHADIAQYVPALEAAGFECVPVGHFREAFENGPRTNGHMAPDGIERPLPVLLLLDTPDFLAAWENDQVRLKHLSRKYVGAIVLHNDHTKPLPDRMAEAAIDEMFRPIGQAAILRAANNAARIIGLEIEKAELRRELGRRTRHMRDIIDIGIALSGERDLQRLLERVLQNARQLTGADAGSIYLVEGEKADTLRFMWAQNESIHVPFREFTMPITTTSIAGFCAATRQIINIDDAYELPADAPYRLDRKFDQSVGYRTKSILCVPMVDHEGVILGVLQLINRKKDFSDKLTRFPDDAESRVVPFDLECQALVSSFASQAAVALNNGILLRRLEDLFEGLVTASVVAIESRDPVTSGHSQRVTTMTVELAKAVSRCTEGKYSSAVFTFEELRELRYAGLLHDFGKVGVREMVLTKAKKLYPAEFQVVLQRFEYIKRTIESEHLRGALEQVADVPTEEWPAFLADVKAAIAEDWTQLDEYLTMIADANEPSVLGAGVSENLAALAELTYPTPTGEMRPYLTAEELKSLSVPRGSLNDEERLEIESHVSHSYNFLKEIPWTRDLKNVPDIAVTHHEKLNGKGYPSGLVEAQIPLQGKMMAIADIFDALTASDRPYKKAMPVEKALNILQMEVKDGHLDAELVDIFIRERVYESVLPPASDESISVGRLVKDVVENMPGQIELRVSAPRPENSRV